MKMIISIALAIAVLTVAGTRIGQSQADLTEYDAVSADGPYSFLPPEQAAVMTPAALGADSEAEHLTPVEALAVGAFLDMLSGPPVTAQPLDAPAPSATALHLAGL